MLRADAHRLGYTRQFTIYDAADSRRLIKKCLDDLDVDVKRFTPRAMQSQISDAKNKLRSADDYRQLVGSYFEQTVADVYEHYERELHRMNAMDFDDLLVPRGQPARALPGGPRPLLRARSAGSWSTSTRTPTTPSTAGSSCWPPSTATLRWSATTHSRSTASAAPTSATSSTSRTTSPTPTSSSSSRTTARRRRSSPPPTRSSRTTAAAWTRTLWTELGEGDPIRGAGAGRRARGGAVRGRRDPADGRRGRQPRRDRRLLPDQRAVAGARGHAGAGGIGYQVIGGTKFYDRAEIKDAIAYLTFLVNPQDQGAFTRIANSPKRGLGQTSLSRVLSHADTMDVPVWEAAEQPEACPGSAPRPRRRSAASCRRWSGCASARSNAPVGELVQELLRETGYIDALQAERTIEAQGRIENLEELVQVAREYDATAEEELARPSSSSRSRCSPTPTTCATTRASYLDDDPQRQGPRVPDRLHDRVEDGVFPHSRASTRATWRRSAGSLRRHHPRDARPHPDLRAPPQRFGARTRSACARASSTRSRPS